MIESFFKNELSLKRYKRFKTHKLAVASIITLFVFMFISFFAEHVANSKPLILSYQSKTYFPTLLDYDASEFKIEDQLIIDYKKLELTGDDWALWPIVRWDPFESNVDVEVYPAPPSKVNWMGTDDRGRDVFARVLYGFRYSIIYAFLVWVITVIVAIFAGGTMGFYGGRIDFIGQRIVEIMSTIPQFFLLIILISVIQPNLYWLVVVTSIFSWIGLSYYIRGEFLKNRNREYVEAAKSLGAGDFKIIFKHILPNSLTPIITYTPFIITAQISGLAGLDYLGFGLPVPTPSWGELLNQAQKNYTIGWWLATFPSMALFSTLVLFNLIGEGVRDAMDPNAT